MEYIVCLKWGGLHGDIVLQQVGGELLYVLQGPGWYYRRFAVVDANGAEIFQVRKASRLLGSTYLIQSAGHTIGKAGSNWLWSHGHADFAELPAVRCKYGWGISSTLEFKDGAKNVANISLLRGIGVRATLRLDDAIFDKPQFLIGCALIFHDWTNRG